jgi:protoporphyrinogen oxidase
MKIAVIGAGFGGMAAAFDLRKAGHAVSIFEADATPGGLAAGFREPGWDWSVEKFYHHWFTSDQHMFRLFRDLGVEDKVLVRSPKTVMYHDGNFYPFDSIPSAILYPGLGYGINKIRFGLVGLYLKLTTNWQPMEKTTVAAWMRKYAGEKVYREMWEPLVVGKFSEKYAGQVNMAWMWARLHARTTKLATYQGGFQAFVDQFAAKLSGMGVDYRFGTRVNMIEKQTDGSLILRHESGSEVFDRVLVTISPTQLAKMAPQLPEDYLKGLLNLKSMGAVVMVIALKHQLSREGYYWYNLPKSAGFPFLALVEHTNFLPPERFGGSHLVYCGDYLDPSHEYFQLSKEELLERFIPSFKRINPAFTPEWVTNTWLTRTPYAQPVPLINHSKNIPAIETPIEGLYFASMSQVYPWDRGTNFAVEIGRRAAGMIMDNQKPGKSL